MQISLKIFGLALLSLTLVGCGTKSIVPPTSIDAEIVQPPATAEIPEISLPQLVPPVVTDQNAAREMPTIEILNNSNLAAPLAEDFAFDTCDTRWQFKTAAWYPNFRDQVNALPTASETNVATICVANDESLIIAMLNGNTDETGGVVRYQPAQNLLEKATFTNPLSLYFYQFKGRVGTTVPMAGGLKTETCESNFIVNYEFSRNTLKPIRECKSCNGAAEVCTRLY